MMGLKPIELLKCRARYVKVKSAVDICHGKFTWSQRGLQFNQLYKDRSAGTH